MLIATLKSQVDEDICLQIQAENHAFRYLCDCGFASQLTVKDCRDTDAIFVSHTHIDHFINFDAIMRHQLAVGRRVIVCGPEGLSANVCAKLQAFNWNLLAFDEHAVSYEVRELSRSQQVRVFHLSRQTDWNPVEEKTYQSAICFENEAFAVRYTLLDHGVETVAYRFDEPDKTKMDIRQSPYKPGKWVQELKAAFDQNQPDRELLIDGQIVRAAELFSCIQREKGYSIGYVMDYAATTANLERIEALFAGADEVYIEAYYRHEESIFSVRNRHSTARVSGAILGKIGVKKAHPVHHSRRYHEESERALLLEEFFEAFAKAELPPLPTAAAQIAE